MEPPRSFKASLRFLGPGAIILGSIVGSGELIMTTRLGALAGFTFLWLVVLSCVSKFVVQAELTRHTISSGKTFLETFNQLPGPGCRRPIWFQREWMGVVLVLSALGIWIYTILDADRFQYGFFIIAGIVVLSGAWAVWIRFRSMTFHSLGSQAETARPHMNWFLWFWVFLILVLFINGGAILGGAGQAIQLAFPKVFGVGGAKVWAVFAAVLCGSLILVGRYSFLERISLGLVFVFTLITIFCTMMLQWTGYGITSADIRLGLLFDFPRPLGAKLVLTALAMYVGTGVGWGEMLAYTYFCVEKGYARFTGPRTEGREWAERGLGWIRVMYADVFLALGFYTVTTICFYFLGAAILHDRGLDPVGPETLEVLKNLYTESLGNWAATLFVVGAFFVLFSTVLSNVAALSRMIADTLCVVGLLDPRDYFRRRQSTQFLVVLILSLYCFSYSLFENPPLMLMISSLSAVIMYPVLGLGTIYLRYARVDPRLEPGRLTSLCLWVCGALLAIISPGVVILALLISSGWLQIPAA